MFFWLPILNDIRTQLAVLVDQLSVENIVNFSLK